MKCSKVRKLINAYVDLEMGANLAEQVRKHIEGCPGCGAEETACRRILSLIDTWPNIEPRRDFEHLALRLNTSIELDSDKHKSWVLPIPAWAAAMLAVISLTAGGIAGVRLDGVTTAPKPSQDQVMAAMDMGAFESGDIIEASVHQAVTGDDGDTGEEIVR